MKTRVVVIGGGISGLAAAHRIQELAREKNLPLEIKLLEADHHLGGVISTVRKEGFLVEGGPDAFISEKPWALDLCRRLGLESEIIGTQNEFRKSFVVRNGKLLPVPEGFYMMAPVRVLPFLESELFSWPAKIRMACELFIPPKQNGHDESVASFIRRRFGVEALERVGEAMVAGIYTADSERLSLRSTFPQFLEMEKEYGSVIRGLKRRKSVSASGPRYSLFLTLKNGMGTLVDALAECLPQNSLEMDAPVRNISRNPTGAWTVQFGRGREIKADKIILTLSAPKMAELIQPLESELANELRQIKHSSVTTVNFAYRQKDIRRPLDGFGFVVPRKENLSMVGCTFSSVKFPGRAPEGFALIRAFIKEGQNESAVKKDLEKLLGIEGEPVYVFRIQHSGSMPQYYVGHLDRVARIETLAQKHDGLFLTGNAFRGIGIPDCVHHAEQAAEQAVA